MQTVMLMPSEPFSVGALAGSTPLVLPMGGAPLPATVQLSSASTTRKIEVTTDNQLTWEQPPPDISTTTKLMVRINVPVTHVRITGVAADRYAIQ